MERPLEDFTGIAPRKNNALTLLLCNAAIIVGLLVMLACSIFIFSDSWNEVKSAALLIVGGALLFGFGLLGRILIDKN